MRMVHGIHADTTNTGPAVTLDAVFVEGATSLKQGLVGTTTTSDETNHGTAVGGQNFLGTRRETETCLLQVVILSNDGGIVPRGTAKLPRSPTFSSTLQTTVPSGRLPRGSTFPIDKLAFLPK